MSRSVSEQPSAAASSDQRLREYLGNLNTPSGDIGIPRCAAQGRVPLSPWQEQIWFHCQLAAGIPIYNELVTIHRDGDLDIALLQRSLNEVIRRHDAWRTTFPVFGGEPCQVVLPSHELQLHCHDMGAYPPEERDVRAWSIATHEARTEFDLSVSPPLRALVIKLNDQRYRLHLVLHQILFDGVSIFSIFVPELLSIYSDLSKGQNSSVSGLPVQYPDYSWQREAENSETVSAQLDYWTEQLSGAPPVLDIPPDFNPPPKQRFRGAQLNFTVPPSTTEQLKQFSRRQGVTLFMTLLASYALLLSRHAGEHDILIGTVTSTRSRPELENVIGLFLNTVALRIRMNDDMSFSELLNQVREVTVNALCNNDIPLYQVLKHLQPSRDARRNPLFQAMFVFEPPARPMSTGWRVSEMDVETGTARVDLHLQMDERPEGLTARFVYSTDLFQRATISRLQKQFVAILEQLTEESRLSLREIVHLCLAGPTGDSTKCNQGLIRTPFVEFGREEIEQSICTRFEQQAARHPQRLAVRTATSCWTYEQLNRTANHLAHALLAKDQSPESRVALLFDHDSIMVAAILAVLKARKTYVPLDPLYPAQRSANMLKDAAPMLVLTNDRNWASACRLPGHLPIINAERVSGVPDTNPDLPISPDALAYILYTSGSSGEPKGVMQNHRNVLFFIRNYTNALHIDPRDRLSLISSYSFDAAVMDMFGALLNGASLFPFDIRKEGITPLAELIKKQQITIYHSTPTVYRYLTATMDANQRFESTRLVVLGGEAVESNDFEAFKTHFPEDSMFVNGFGPTESTLALQYFLSKKNDIRRVTVPLGYPVEDTEIVLLDDYGKETRIRGEIGVRSAHVAVGYWNRPQLTAAAFLHSPDATDRRIYRTGDMGYVLPDGAIEFLGRKDQQVKIRGFRIELAEVEAAMAAHPAVRFAAARCHKVDGESRLFAYVVLNPDGLLSETELLQFLRSRIPDYMLPSGIALLSELPVTRTGKIDRLALPLLHRTQLIARDTARMRPNQIEAELVRIWEDLLKTSPIGLQQNFFDLGGHSLLVAKLLKEIEEAFQKKLTMAAVFRSPTIEELAKVVASNADHLPFRGVVPIKSSGSRPPLFCVRGASLFRTLALQLGLDQPVLGLHLEPAEAAELELPYDFREIAAVLTKRVLEVQPTGPYYLAGLCVNGLLAYEIAQQLLRQGLNVGLLVMLDTQNPAFHLNFLREQGRTAITTARIRYHSRKLLHSPLGKWGEVARDRGQGIERRMSRLVWQAAYNLRVRVRENWMGDLDPIIHPSACVYKPLPFPARALLFESSEHPQGMYWQLQAHWRELIPQLTTHRLEGDHDAMLRNPNVRTVAEVLGAMLRETQAPGEQSSVTFLGAPVSC